MFSLYTQTPQFFNDICDEIRLFFDVKKINLNESDHLSDSDYFLVHRFSQNDYKWFSEVILIYKNQNAEKMSETISIPVTKSELELKKQKKRFIKNSVYKCLKSYTQKKLPWGSLTGIRPTKLARELSESLDRDKAQNLFKSTYDVKPEKIKLTFDIIDRQKNALSSIEAKDIDIYINIPFCVSRCKYCSFITHDFKRTNRLKSAYIDALNSEIELIKPFLADYSFNSLYIGGGTPTALDDAEFRKLLNICENLGNFKEFSVEAGRPDTISQNKLAIMKNYGVDRISINPQTLNQRTLDLVERKHSVEQFYNAYKTARNYGFKCINIDLILGLPGESGDNMRYSVNRIIDLEPQNITLHTLALKRSSELTSDPNNHFCDSNTIEELIENSREILSQHNYYPYYMYRQKYMNGNLENTGFSKEGLECLYNIGNMEEVVSIAAFGAGAISKRIYNKQKRIERQANVKDVELYIKNFAEMADRKKKLFN